MIYLCQKNIAFEKIEKKHCFLHRHLNIQYQELKCHFYLACIAVENEHNLIEINMSLNILRKTTSNFQHIFVVQMYSLFS